MSEFVGAARLVYEDEDILVLDKPPLLHSVRSAHSNAASLADALLARDLVMATAAEKSGDAGLIQRLDYSTCGLIIAAKNRTAWTQLHSALREGCIDKCYLVIVEGEFSSPALVSNYLGSDNRGAKKVQVSNNPKKRFLPAQSEFSPLTYFTDHAASLAKVRAPTARRHQVRAHAGCLKHPLVGDSSYGSRRLLQDLDSELVGDFYLCAWKIHFKHPRSQVLLNFESSLRSKLVQKALSEQGPYSACQKD